jgi:hypothetical protein
VIEPALLRGRDRYERVTRGRVDNTHDDAFTHTVVLDDPDRAIEVSASASASRRTSAAPRAAPSSTTSPPAC